MQLNCKVIKKVATPSFLNQRPLPPLFRVIAKFLVLQSDSIFGRGYPLLIIDLIVNINLDYLKKTVHKLFTTNIEEGVL